MSETTNVTKQFLDKDGLNALWSKMCETFTDKDALGNYLPLVGGTMKGTLNSQSIIPTSDITYNLGSSTKSFNTTYTRYIDTKSNYSLRLKAAGAEHISMYDGTINTTAHIIPTTSNTYNLGNASYKWKNIYATNFIENGANINTIYADKSYADYCSSYLHSANRAQFCKPEGVTLEYSIDGGSTWVDYDATDEQKIGFFSGISQNFKLGKALSTKALAADMLRLTMDATAMGFYTSCKSLLLNISTNGSSNFRVKVEKSMKGSEDTFDTHIESQTLTGWSGWNRIPIGNSFGGGDTQTWNIAKLRLIFMSDGADSSYTSGAHASILDMEVLGTTYWTVPHTMAKTGHIYSWDALGNATFGKNVTASALYITGSKNNTTAHISSDAAYNMYFSSNNVIPLVINTSTANPVIRAALGLNEQVDLGSQTVKWRNIYSKTLYEDGISLVNKYAAKDHTHSYLTGTGAQNSALSRNLTDFPKEKTLFTGGWNTSTGGYATNWGTTLDISYSTYYQRLAFNTTGRIEYFRGINTNNDDDTAATLTKVGDLAYTSDIPTTPTDIGAAPATHTHTIANITDFGTHIYDATVSRTKNTVLAAPANADGPASFRALVVNDLPVITASKGGSGQTTLQASANAYLNALSTGSSDPTDNDYYISQYAAGGTTTTTYHRRPVSALYNYVKGKLDSVYAPINKSFIINRDQTDNLTSSEITSYADLSTATSGQSAFKLLNSGSYKVARSGGSDLLINLGVNTGSTSALEFLTNYTHTSRLKVRKVIDNNRVSGAFKELAWYSDIPTTLKNPYSLTIQGNGMTLTNGVYDGSASKIVNITPLSIGAASADDVNGSLYKTIYAGEKEGSDQGILIKTSVDETSNAMMSVKITGNIYGAGSTKPILTLIEFYNYYNNGNGIAGNRIINVSGAHFGVNLGTIKIFNYDNKICLWIPQTGNYQSFNVFANWTNSLGVKNNVNVVESLTKSILPSTTTYLVDFIPKSVAYDGNATSSNGGHTHTINATTSTTEVAAKTHSHTVTATGNVESTFTGTQATTSNNTSGTTVASSGHTHTISGSITVNTQRDSSDLRMFNVTFSFSGSSSATTSTTEVAAKTHSHTVTATGNVESTFTGTQATTSNNTSGTTVASSGHTHTTSNDGSHSHTI